jgi:hypothetical protein
MSSRPLQLQWVGGRPRVLRYGCPLGQPAAPAPAPAAPALDLEAARAALEAGAAGAAWRAVLEAGPAGAAEAERLEAEAEAELQRALWRRACLNG